MTNPDSTNELTLRIKTGFIVATGIGALVYTPIFVVGIFVILLAFIGSLEFTEMLSKGNRNRIIKIPKWFLPGTSVLMGFGVLNGELWLHITLILSALCLSINQTSISIVRNINYQNRHKGYYKSIYILTRTFLFNKTCKHTGHIT